ncbi:hypothetical protein BDV23DRAFT_176162 [Aspergillus alliaceus]|uniref:Uncharacterized protein n=1 Tax=Petromyces alliaceus TaxID=209559 RepID=A0A5N7BUM0_PETAA|nr:uncharacterized protein BDW43DRAFT_304223 [Aspergillus alliaceus]KAB8228008.1 hypothetical protein BDW43DRAFT_304223 [Aspergillus alliaceus]KAE8385535.1 hypothetical protein BDV23DRAFT_176162 [Aspergillus alliaceus]
MAISLERLKPHAYQQLDTDLPHRPKAPFNWQLDVFHSLHCLNYVRKSLDREHYSSHLEHMESLARNSPHLPDDWGRIHLDHCLDQLMQSVLCHADLSPVPMFSWEGVPLFLGVGQTHTCRAWGPIRGWLDRRNERYTPIEEE